MAATDDPVLTRFRAAPDAAYGDRIERVVLFGARAAITAPIRTTTWRCSCATSANSGRSRARSP